MKKLKRKRRLSRKSNQRKALLRSLARELFLKEKIKTSEARAKEISGFAEKQISRAKMANLSSRRLLLRHFSPEVAKKLVNEIAPRYKEKKGGYTRVIKLGPRKLDGAKMAIIELVK
jgi:large subunit ribosomal protein L17